MKKVIMIIPLFLIVLASGCTGGISTSLLPTKPEIESLGYQVTDLNKMPENQRIFFVGHYNAIDGDSESFYIQKGNSEKINITQVSMLKYSSSAGAKANFDSAKESGCKSWSSGDQSYTELSIQQIGDGSCGVEWDRNDLGGTHAAYLIYFYKGSFEVTIFALRDDKTSWENSPIVLSDIIKIAKLVESKIK